MAISSNYLSQAESPSFTVTGHSLGGFLATGIAADFAGNVSHAYLYNSPGLGGIVGSMPPFNALHSLSEIPNDIRGRIAA